MWDSCNRFVSLDDVLRLVPDIAGLIAAKPCSGDMESGRFGGLRSYQNCCRRCCTDSKLTIPVGGILREGVPGETPLR